MLIIKNKDVPELILKNEFLLEELMNKGKIYLKADFSKKELAKFVCAGLILHAKKKDAFEAISKHAEVAKAIYDDLIDCEEEEVPSKLMKFYT